MMEDTSTPQVDPKFGRYRHGLRTDVRAALAILEDLRRDIADVRVQLAQQRPEQTRRNVNALDR